MPPEWPPGYYIPPVDPRDATIAKLRSLVAKLYDGLDDYWVTLPENAELVSEAARLREEAGE